MSVMCLGEWDASRTSVSSIRKSCSKRDEKQERQNLQAIQRKREQCRWCGPMIGSRRSTEASIVPPCISILAEGKFAQRASDLGKGAWLRSRLFRKGPRTLTKLIGTLNSVVNRTGCGQTCATSKVHDGPWLLERKQGHDVPNCTQHNLYITE